MAEFKGALLFLVTAGVIVPLFRRLRVSPVIGFLAAGVLLGPYGLQKWSQSAPWLAPLRIDNLEEIAALAEFGVVFLLFMIGLELSFERLARLKKLVFGLGAMQVAVSTAALGGVATFFFNQTPAAALVIGASLALSSTAIVIPSLVERRRLGTSAGRAAFAVLLAQDLMVAPLLFMVSMLGTRTSGGFGEGLLYAVLPAAAAVALIVGAGRLLLRPLFHQVAGAHSTEFFMAACLLVVMGTGILSAMAGLSMALGAFIAGLLLAETEYRREIEVTIEPFKGLLLGLFFVSIGAGLDLGAVARAPGLVLGVAVGLIVAKSAILFVLARLVGVRAPAARETALLLGPGGEFAFVMFGASLTEHIVPEGVGADLMVAVTLSMLAIPALASQAARTPARMRKTDADLVAMEPPASGEGGGVIIVGYGRVGKLVGDMLTRHDKPFIAIDGSANLVRSAREKAKNIYWGDATRLELLRHCGIATAEALVVTLDAPHAAERVVELARKERPDLTIVARARDAHHATHLYELGATDAIPETVEASLQLSEAVLVDIGVPMGFVIASIHEKRDEFRQLLQSGEGQERRAIRLSTRVKTFGRKREEHGDAA